MVLSIAQSPGLRTGRLDESQTVAGGHETAGPGRRWHAAHLPVRKPPRQLERPGLRSPSRLRASVVAVSRPGTLPWTEVAGRMDF